MKTILLCLACLVISNELSASPTNKANKVVFIAPSSQDSPFFSKTAAIMKAAAVDLDLDLEVVYGNDLVIISNQASAVLDRKELPDYLVLTHLRGVTEELMRKADNLGIHTLLFNTGLSHRSISNFRYGFQPLNNWIGQVLSDDVQAGRLTAQKLVEAARASGTFDEQNKIQLIGVNGSLRSPASTQREKGLRQYVSEQSDVLLHQVVYTEWSSKDALNKTGLLLNRFKDISVIWTAADLLSLGAVQAARLNNMVPGEDVYIAGVDWLPEIYSNIADNSIAGSAGGHSFDGAWALVVIYDHINGISNKFVNEHTYFNWIDKNSLGTAQKLMDPQLWKDLNFCQYSKTHSQERGYRFSVDRLLESPLFSNQLAKPDGICK